MEDLSEQVFQMKTKIAQFEETEMQKSQQLETSRLENLKLSQVLFILNLKIEISSKPYHKISYIICVILIFHIFIN